MVTRGELPEMAAIEADEAVLGSEPQEPVACLADGVNRRLEQPFLLTPDAMRVLGESPIRIERLRRPGT
jgi:hypothetical protein